MHNRDGAIFALFDGSVLEQLVENCSSLLVGVSRIFCLLEAFFELGDLFLAFRSHNFLEIFGFELVLQLSLRSLALRASFQHAC